MVGAVGLTHPAMGMGMAVITSTGHWLGMKPARPDERRTWRGGGLTHSARGNGQGGDHLDRALAPYEADDG